MPRTKKATTKPIKKLWTSEDDKKAIANMEFVKPDFSTLEGIPVKSENSYADIDCLAIFCDNFDRLEYEDKVRVFAFITSRYSNFLPSQKI